MAQAPEPLKVRSIKKQKPGHFLRKRNALAEKHSLLNPACEPLEPFAAVAQEP